MGRAAACRRVRAIPHSTAPRATASTRSRQATKDPARSARFVSGSGARRTRRYLSRARSGSDPLPAQDRDPAVEGDRAVHEEARSAEPLGAGEVPADELVVLREALAD